MSAGASLRVGGVLVAFSISLLGAAAGCTQAPVAKAPTSGDSNDALSGAGKRAPDSGEPSPGEPSSGESSPAKSHEISKGAQKFVPCDDESEECRAVLDAELSLAKGDTARAQALLQPWLQSRDVHQVVVHLYYGQAQLESESMAYGAGGEAASSALKSFDALLRETPLAEAVESRILLQKARALLALGRGESALPILRALSQQLPQEAEVQAALGIAYLAVGQVSRSLSPLEKASELDSQNAERQLVLGTARMLVGEYAQAERSFRAALALDANSASACGGLGALLLLQGNAKGGRQYLQRAVLLEPERATFVANLAYAELLNDRPQEAKKEAEKAIRLDPALASGWLNLGLAQVSLGDKAAARTSFEKAQSLDPTDPRPKNNLQDLDELEGKAPAEASP